MKNFKKHNRSIMMRVLVTYLILSAVLLVLLVQKFSLIYDLEKETYNEIAYSIGQDREYGELNEQLEKIMRTFEDQKQAIEKKTILNFMTGFLVTMAISLTSINKIIKNSKTLWQEFSPYKERVQEDKDEYHEKKETSYERGLCFKIDETTYTCEEIKEILQQIHECKENKGELRQEEKMVQKLMMLLIDQFIQTLSQTTYYTHQIYHDKEQLATAVDEVKKGIQQIIQITSIQQNREDVYSDEDMVVAVHQMNAGIEEMNELLIQLEEKIKGLEENVQRYQHSKQNHL